MRLYIVKQGDTLSSIADKYGLELEQLLAINPQITNPDEITPGMKIKIAAGPVSVSPGTPEIGHPIHQTPTEGAQSPFMQVPVPAVEAGAVQAGGQQAETVNQQVMNLNDSNQNLHPNPNQNPHQNQPYLSTIPYHFAGNPLYSGVGSAGSAGPGTGAGQPLVSQSNVQYANIPQPNMQQPSGVMGMANVSNASVGGAANIHVPYNYQSAQYPYTPVLNPYGAMGGWNEVYTWSSPFDQMANQSFLPTAAPNMPVAAAAAKKPCGCGGRTVGYYSLAEKQRMEETADGMNEEYVAEGASSLHAAEGDKGFTIEQDGNAESHENMEVRSAISQDSGTETVKSGKRKRSRSRSRKRSDSRKKRSTIELHARPEETKSQHSSQFSQTSQTSHSSQSSPSKKMSPGQLWLNV